MTNATQEAVTIDKSSNTPAKPKGTGGRPKGFNPLMPLSTTPALNKAAGEMAAKALAELTALGDALGKDPRSVDDLLVLLTKTEAITHDIFAAASVRWLQRGMLLCELYTSFKSSDGGNWMEFYLDRVQPVTKLAERSEQACRGLWTRWLECQEQGFDATPLLAGNLGVNAMNDALKQLLNGEDAEDVAEAVKRKPRGKNSPMQSIRNKGRSLSKETAQFNAATQDPHLRALLSKLNEVLTALDEYTEAWEDGTPAVDTTAADVSDPTGDDSYDLADDSVQRN